MRALPLARQLLNATACSHEKPKRNSMRVSLSQGELYFFLCPCLSRLRTSRRHFLVRGQFRFGVRATTPGFRSYGNGYEYWGLLAMVAALPWLGGERGRSKVDRQEYLNTCVGTILSAHSHSRVGLLALLTLSRSTRPLNSLSISTLSDLAKGHGSAKRHTPATTSPASQKLPVRRPQSTHGLIMCPKLRQLPHAANR